MTDLANERLTEGRVEIRTKGMTNWRADQLTSRPTDWLPAYQATWQTESLTDYMKGWQTDGPTDWRIEGRAKWLTNWRTDGMNDWLTDWLKYVSTIELTDPNIDKINRLPDWLASLSTLNLLHDSLYRSEDKWVQVHFATLWIFTTCYLKINNKQVKWLNLTRKMEDWLIFGLTT